MYNVHGLKGKSRKIRVQDEKQQIEKRDKQTEKRKKVEFAWIID